MMNTPGPGAKIAPNQLWMLAIGSNSLVLALICGVFRTFKNGLRPDLRPFSDLTLSPMTEQDSMHRAQVIMCHGPLTSEDPHVATCVGVALIQHPSQFICKLPEAAWSVDHNAHTIQVAQEYHAFIAHWTAACPLFWEKLKFKGKK